MHDVGQSGSARACGAIDSRFFGHAAGESAFRADIGARKRIRRVRAIRRRNLEKEEKANHAARKNGPYCICTCYIPKKRDCLMAIEY